MRRTPLLAALALSAAAGCSKPAPVPIPAHDAPITIPPDAKPEPATTPPPAARTEADNRARSAANLRQIVLAIHNFESTYGHLPWNVVSSTKPPVALLSWRVRLLPYLGYNELYKKFDLDRPWDSEQNKALIKEIPVEYASASGTGGTFYQAFVGKGTLWATADSADKPRIVSVKDGTSNTFAVVEAATPVVWTKPDDIPFDAGKPLPPLGGEYADGFHAAMYDGAVYFVRKGTDPAALKAFVTPSGGEVAKRSEPDFVDVGASRSSSPRPATPTTAPTPTRRPSPATAVTPPAPTRPPVPPSTKVTSPITPRTVPPRP